MIWLKGSDYHYRTSCDTYTVCRVRLNGRLLSEAWRGRECLGREFSAVPEGMQAVCESDMRACAQGRVMTASMARELGDTKPSNPTEGA